MENFIVLLSQIFGISLLQMIFDAFIDTDSYPFQKKIINFTCFVGSLYLVLLFIFNNLFVEINNIVSAFF